MIKSEGYMKTKPVDWTTFAKNVIEHMKKDNWVYSSSLYLKIIDDVVSGALTHAEMKFKYRSSKKKDGSAANSPDIIESALYHVVKPNGGKPRIPVADGGWCDPKLVDGHYVVSNDFKKAWFIVRGL